MDRHSLLRAAINTGAAGIARVYRLVRRGDGRRGALRVEIHVAPDGSGAWHAWTSVSWPSDGIQYDMRGTIEAQTPEERSDALAAELTELETDLHRKPANRVYARSRWYSNDEIAAAIKTLRGALGYNGVQDDGGTEGQEPEVPG